MSALIKEELEKMAMDRLAVLTAILGCVAFVGVIAVVGMRIFFN